MYRIYANRDPLWSSSKLTDLDFDSAVISSIVSDPTTITSMSGLSEVEVTEALDAYGEFLLPTHTGLHGTDSSRPRSGWL